MNHPPTEATGQKRAREEIIDPYLCPKRSRIARWLEDSALTGPLLSQFHRRTKSAPDQFTGHPGLQFNHLQSDLLDGIDLTEPATVDDDSGLSEESKDEKSRRSVSTVTNHLTSLRDHSIYIDPNGDLIPGQLRKFLDENIMNDLGDDLVSEQDYQRIRQIRAELADANKSLVSQLYWSPIFPDLPPGLAQEGKTTWDTTTLSGRSGLPCTLVAPKSDFYIGYNIVNREGSFNISQCELMDHTVSRPYAAPSRKHYFPFLMVEMKSDPAGGTLTEAEYQAAASGSACVSGIRWFLDAAKRSQGLKAVEGFNAMEELTAVEKTVSFSVTMNHRLLSLHVHWYSAEKSRFSMSLVRDFRTSEIQDVRQFAAAISNIYSWAMGPRLDMIRSMLHVMCQSPREWMLSRKRGPQTDQQSKPKR